MVNTAGAVGPEMADIFSVRRKTGNVFFGI